MNRWDKYFLDVCNTVASNSTCLSRKIGAIIVRDKSIISTGYNGVPKNVPHCGLERWEVDKKLQNEIYNIHFSMSSSLISTTCPRKLLGYKSGEGLEWCPAGHGERNSLINAAKIGVSVKGAKMYMNCPIPCGPCMVEILNAEIEELIVVSLDYYDYMSEYLIANSGIKIRTYDAN
jgi:dCMP deaminase